MADGWPDRYNCFSTGQKLSGGIIRSIGGVIRRLWVVGEATEAPSVASVPVGDVDIVVMETEVVYDDLGCV